MTIYVVTHGSYSEYSIERIFSNKAAAEEYRDWHNIDNPIEEYELYDTPFNFEGEDEGLNKYIEVSMRASVCCDGHVIFDSVDVTKKVSTSPVREVFYSPRNQDIVKYVLLIYKYFDPVNFVEETCLDRVKKSVYDIVAVINTMLSEGATTHDINAALSQREPQGDN